MFVELLLSVIAAASLIACAVAHARLARLERERLWGFAPQKMHCYYTFGTLRDYHLVCGAVSPDGAVCGQVRKGALSVGCPKIAQLKYGWLCPEHQRLRSHPGYAAAEKPCVAGHCDDDER